MRVKIAKKLYEAHLLYKKGTFYKGTVSKSTLDIVVGIMKFVTIEFSAHGFSLACLDFWHLHNQSIPQLTVQITKLVDFIK